MKDLKGIGYFIPNSEEINGSNKRGRTSFEDDLREERS